MDKLIYFGWIAPSSLNATIKLFEQLLSKNIKIYYIGFEYSRKKIEDMGITFIPYMDFNRIENPYLEDMRDYNFNFKSKEELLDYLYLYNKYKIYQHEIIMDSLIDIIKKISPKYIFRDLEALVGKLIGDKLKINTVSVSTTVMTSDEFYIDDLIEKINLTTNIDLKKTKFIKDLKYSEIISDIKEKSLKDKITYINPINCFYGDDFINLGFGALTMNTVKPCFENRIVQPSLNIFREIPFDEELESFSSSNKKLIYVATGSGITNGNEFYNLIINTLDPNIYNIIFSIPNSKFNKKLPSNIIIRNFLPQQEILKRADIFITSGGYNSICEAINFEVPMITIPLMNDQFMNGYLLEKLNFSKVIEKDKFTKEKLLNSINSIIKDNFYNKKIKNIKKETFNLNTLENELENILKDVSKEEE